MRDDTEAGPVRVWDLPTRVFHWLLAASVVGLVITGHVGGNALAWHMRLGLLVGALLAWLWVEGPTPRSRLAGLLWLARHKGLRPVQLDLRSSGDTAGDKARVVGYGAFAFY